MRLLTIGDAIVLVIYHWVVHLIFASSCWAWLQNWTEVHLRSANKLRIDSAAALGHTRSRWSTKLGPLALQVWPQKLLFPIRVGKTRCFLVAGNSHLCLVRRAGWLRLARSACYASAHNGAVLNCGPSTTQINCSTNNYWCLPSVLWSRLSLCLRLQGLNWLWFLLILLGEHVS